ncbi:hypothetical protein FRC12_015348 [Ceratobasidium sp. 428]|nr:hypothetical protein FRC12_015348 [Ceratobasidium sp. 428]
MYLAARKPWRSPARSSDDDACPTKIADGPRPQVHHHPSSTAPSIPVQVWSPTSSSAQQPEAGSSPLTVPHVANSGLVPPRAAFSPGPSGPGQEEDVLAAMYSLSGDFWDNALLPGTWEIAGNGMGNRGSR